MKINKKNSETKKIEKEISGRHLNHMNGVGYDISNPIKELRIMASSSFFGEPNYYHEDVKVISEDIYGRKPVVPDYNYLEKILGKVISIPDYHNESTTTIMEKVIDAALNFNAEETLKEAVRLRNEDNIRTTPQVIMVRAANNEKVRGTGLIGKYFKEIMKRTDEAALQLAYQIQVFGRPVPNALKKAWKSFLEGQTEFQLAKYRMEKKTFKTVDVVNLVHAKGDAIDKLMKGKLSLNENTWESYISKHGSSKETWTHVVSLMGHMALLRNIVNFIKNEVDYNVYLPKLIATVESGKQLPFRYVSAYNMAKKENANGVILDAIEECLEKSLGNLPKFEGRTMSLCDNSGSAHGTFTSAAGTMSVAQIANLTAVITGKASDEGYVGVFGDKLEVFSVMKKASILQQKEKADSLGENIGHNTENGIWIFLDNAIKNKEHWDNIFIYSDQQAGHGGLYGLDAQKDYPEFIWEDSNPNYSYNYGAQYIDVAALIKKYRETVNPNVHVFMVQVAGYKDTLMPEFYDKTYILGGWGDGLLRFAKEMQKN